MPTRRNPRLATSTRCAGTAGSVGELKACQVLSETPQGLGLAEAAQRLSGRFHITTDPVPGARRDVQIDLPIHFTGDAAASEAPSDLGWSRMPPPELAQALFPEVARAAGTKTGHATLSCAIANDGGLKLCAVEHEEPAGQGFGAAALIMADLMGTSPWTTAGRPIAGAHVTLPLRFDAPADASPVYHGQMADFGGWSRNTGTAGPYTPDRACRMGVRHGVAVLSCQVEGKGKLSQCQPVTDSPRDYGFMQAAWVMAQRGELTAPTAPASNGRFVPIVAEFDQAHGCG